MAALIPLSSFLKIPQACHMAPLEQPEPVNVAILQFLKDAHRTK
jgi:pimeloyl-ACP methyl ester carboxylesterase